MVRQNPPAEFPPDKEPLSQTVTTLLELRRERELKQGVVDLMGLEQRVSGTA